MVKKTIIAGVISSKPVAQPKVFAQGVYWKKLALCSDVIPDPTAKTYVCEPTNTNEVEGIKHFNLEKSLIGLFFK